MTHLEGYYHHLLPSRLWTLLAGVPPLSNLWDACGRRSKVLTSWEGIMYPEESWYYKEDKKLMPKSISYLVHAAGTGARAQTCHSARQLLKILLITVDFTSWSRQLHCKHKEEIHQRCFRKTRAVLHPVELSAMMAMFPACTVQYGNY